MKTRQRNWRHFSEYLFPGIAAGAAEIQRRGGLVGIGSHGEMPGIGMHWEMEAHVIGGMTPMEAIHAATIGSAETIGRQDEFGSINSGKFADLIILTADPRANIRNTLAIGQVIKNGRLYDGQTLNEVWPRKRPLPEPWFRHDMPPTGMSRTSRNRLNSSIERSCHEAADCSRHTCASGVEPATAQDKAPADPPKMLVEIYRVAPGKHRGIHADDRAFRRGQPPGRTAAAPALRSPGRGGLGLLMFIQPADTPKGKEKALADAYKALNTPRGPDFFVKFRSFIAEHTDTFVSGPTNAADWLRKLDEARGPR